MGSFLGKTLDDNMTKQQEFMQEGQRVMLERNIQMQNEMRERMMAQQIARSRELFQWLSAFYLISSIGMIRGYRITKKPITVAPLLPLTFLVGYQYDLCYGTKINRIKAEAENILMFERDMIESPCGLPTVATLDMGRLKQEESAKYHSIQRPD